MQPDPKEQKSAAPEFDAAAAEALARLHHAYFLGLLLTVATRKDRTVMGEWMFRLFRRQHLDKFLASFDKLGLTGLPDAVACARYHVISNSVGGVPVEYIYENDRKAWVRFRYPRWMFDGPTICGVPLEVSRGFLEGWYAHNGVSLNNPRLGFVCVSEDMTGEFGLCGYFKEYDHDLHERERLVFAKDERPPSYVAADQPTPPSSEWSAERLAKANRNYAVEYVRNGLCELGGVLGEDEARELGSHAARLIGLQYYRETRVMLGLDDATDQAGIDYLVRMLEGFGDRVEQDPARQTAFSIVRPRIVRDLVPAEQHLVFASWNELWVGALRSGRMLFDLHGSFDGDRATWVIAPER